MKFKTYKYEEAALTVILHEKIKEIEEDNKFNFLDGVRLGFLVHNIIFYYRLKKQLMLSPDSLSPADSKLYDECLKLEDEFGLDFIDPDYMSEKWMEVFNDAETIS